MFRVLTGLLWTALTLPPSVLAFGGNPEKTSGWQTPPKEAMEVLHAPRLPQVWTSPTGERSDQGDTFFSKFSWVF